VALSNLNRSPEVLFAPHDPYGSSDGVSGGVSYVAVETAHLGSLLRSGAKGDQEKQNAHRTDAKRHATILTQKGTTR
jgi:hypothetical protein